MTTDISFESVLHTVTVAYMIPLLLLVLFSAFGLAVIETLEEVSEL